MKIETKLSKKEGINGRGRGRQVNQGLEYAQCSVDLYENGLINTQYNKIKKFS